MLRRSIQLKKDLGQCFLRDKAIADRIAGLLDRDLPVVEIGCGDGFYTQALLKLGHRVIGIEIDKEMLSQLKRRVRGFRNFTLKLEDVLKLDWESIFREFGPFQVTGNIPFHLTSPILFRLFELARWEPQPVKKVVITLQQEVAERLAASPNSKAYGALTLMAKYHGSVTFHFTIPSRAFFPEPKVAGGVVEIKFLPLEQMPKVDWHLFRALVRSCFAQRRKMMRNAIRVLNNLPEEWRHIFQTGSPMHLNFPFDWTKRPENVTFNEFVELASCLQRAGISLKLNYHSFRD